MRAVMIAAMMLLAGCGAGGNGGATATDVQTPPLQIGDCAETRVAMVGSRLEGVPDSGSAITYADGLSQVEYEAVAGIDHSQPGDQVRLCLVSLPQDCPPGDERGRVYEATNLRTGETWQAPDSEHMCGGA